MLSIVFLLQPWHAELAAELSRTRLGVQRPGAGKCHRRQLPLPQQAIATTSAGNCHWYQCHICSGLPVRRPLQHADAWATRGGAPPCTACLSLIRRLAVPATATWRAESPIAHNQGASQTQHGCRATCLQGVGVAVQCPQEVLAKRRLGPPPRSTLPTTRTLAALVLPMVPILLQ